MTTYPATARTRLHRRPSRASYDASVVHSILDEALLCHLAFVADGQPYTLPTTFVRDGERLFVHGSAAGRLMRSLSEGPSACLSVTLVDGLVLARSAFHHSMNYRSVVVLGAAREVTDEIEKRRAMQLLIDKMSPARSPQVRPPTDNELRATTVLAMALEEVSAKVRTGPPIEDEDDLGLPVWAGVVPVALRSGQPVPDGVGVEAFELPATPRGIRG